MAKDKAGAKPRKAKVKIPKEIAGVRIPKALRDTGNAAIKMAQQPGTREMLSAGLMAAATAVAVNARARSAARGSVAQATPNGDGQAAMAEAANAAAETAQQIGAALIGAAGLAAQRFFGLADDQVVAERPADATPVSEPTPGEPVEASAEQNGPDAAPAAAATRRSSRSSAKSPPVNGVG